MITIDFVCRRYPLTQLSFYVNKRKLALHEKTNCCIKCYWIEIVGLGFFLLNKRTLRLVCCNEKWNWSIQTDFMDFQRCNFWHFLCTLFGHHLAVVWHQVLLGLLKCSMKLTNSGFNIVFRAVLFQVMIQSSKCWAVTCCFCVLTR